MLIPALTFAAFAFAASGDMEQAVTLAEEFERTARISAGFSYPVLPTMLRVSVAAGELALAQSLVDGAAEASRSQLLLNSTTSARATLAEAHASAEEAATLYAEAAAAWEEWGSVVERAYALLGLGRCGDEDAAREAAAIFERLGATPVLAHAA